MKRLSILLTFSVAAIFLWWNTSTPPKELKEAVNNSSRDSVDLVIFSYHRPAQLYTLLESIETHVSGLGYASVIYRADNLRYDNAYAEVQERFPNVTFRKQGKNPRADFKPLVIEESFANPEGNKSPYLLFAVDDNVVKEDVDLRQCVRAMEETGAYAFFLRLGHHLTHCYMANNAPMPLPPLTRVQDNIYSWSIDEAQLDWGYPNNVDMTIYRKRDILDPLYSARYKLPTKLESRWSKKRKPGRKGLCFKRSKIINIPLNLVQTESLKNRFSTASIGPEELLTLWESGSKLRFNGLAEMENPSVHFDVQPEFVLRASSKRS